MVAGVFFRFVRIQFVPVMLAPVLLGTATAWYSARAFAPLLFLLVIAGAVLLHLAANAIDDVYDFLNGVDKVSDQMFPRDAPGWKPIPRGVLSVRGAFALSYVLYGVSLLIGLYLSLVVGWYALGIAIPGVLLSYFYVAPPLKLDYRGAGLGELSILLSFGPIPALGAYYVLTGQISMLPVVLAIPAGILTTVVLISHDLIFYDAYKQSGKRSLAVVLGRRQAARLVTFMAVIAYLYLLVLLSLRVVPVYSAAAFLALPLLPRLADAKGVERPPPEYGPRTMSAFWHSVAFTTLFAVGLFLS